MRYLATRCMKGSRRNASSRKVGVFSDFDFFASSCGADGTCAGTSGTGWSAFVNEVRAERAELIDDVLIAATDDAHIADDRLAAGTERRDQVAEPAAEIG